MVYLNAVKLRARGHSRDPIIPGGRGCCEELCIEGSAIWAMNKY